MALANFILSASSNVSARLIASEASDHACPILDANMLGSRLLDK